MILLMRFEKFLSARLLACLLAAFGLFGCLTGTSHAAEIKFLRAYQGSLSGQTFTTTAVLNADQGSIRFSDGGTQRAFQNTSGTLYYTVGGVLHVETGVLNSRYPNGNTLMDAVAFSGTGGDRLLVLGSAYTTGTSYSGSSNGIVAKLNEYVDATAPDPASSTLAVNGSTSATVPVGQALSIVATIKLSSGSPIAGAVVTLADSPSGTSTIMPGTVTTDSAGQAIFSVQGVAPGTVTYTAIASASGTTSASGAVSVTYTGVRSAAHTTATVPGGHAGVPTTVTVVVRDTAGNPVTGAAGGLAAVIGGTNAGAPPSAIAETGGGSYTFTYTPTIVGTDTVAITLDGTAINGSPYASIVAAPTLTITPAAGTLPGGTVGTGYSQSLTISGGTAPYAYAATGLPAGLAIDPATGAVTGTPTQDGSYTVTVSVTDAGGAVGSATYTLVIAVQAPTTGAVSTTVAANSSANAIALDLGGGAAASVAVANGPAHGTVTVSGTTITYTPAPGYSGADSFTYTATNASGTSQPATVGITVVMPTLVVTPAAGTLPGGTVGTGYSQSLTISGGTAPYAFAATGLPAGLAIDPATGAVTGTPTQDGSYTVTVSVTDAGGAVGSATYTLVIAVQAPTTGAVSTTVAANSSANAIALDLGGGTAASVAVASGPAHGTVAVSGVAITYTPAPGYSGADSFTYTATNASGTSQPATVGITVVMPTLTIAPAAGTLPGGTVGSGYSQSLTASGGTAPYAFAATGLPAGLAIDPATGAITGTPTQDGTYNVTVTVTDAGGAVGSGSFVLAIAAPPPPVAADSTSASVPANTRTEAGQHVDINLSSLVSGEYDDIRIVAQPRHGSVTLTSTLALRAGGGIFSMAAAALAQVTVPRQVMAVYTPDPDFQGTDSFQFAATGPGGTSMPATVVIEVVGRAPVAAAKSVNAVDGQTVSIDLTDNASNGPFTAAAIVSVSPADKARAAIVAGSGTAAGTYLLQVTPAARYQGTVRIAYTLTNAFGTSQAAMVTVEVARRPDPTSDPVVRAISDAQAETTRRFARAQMANVMRRAESLHGECRSSANELRLTSTDGAFNAREAADSPRDGQVRPAATDQAAPVNGQATEESGCANAVAVWSGGTIDISTRDAQTGRSRIAATTSGISAGIDLRVAEGVTVGVAGSLAHDSSRIGGGGDAQVSGTASIAAIYASLSPARGLFVDGALSRGWIGFDAHRQDATSGATTFSARDGRFTAGAISAGIDRLSGVVRWSLYGRADVLRGTLDAYRENGAGPYDLRFDDRSIRSTTGTVGFRLGYATTLASATAAFSLRGEWLHEFSGGGLQRLDYADIAGDAFYALSSQGWTREQFVIAPGIELTLPAQWEIAFDLGLRAGGDETAATAGVQARKRF